jgi:hypothetical protein
VLNQSPSHQCYILWYTEPWYLSSSCIVILSSMSYILLYWLFRKLNHKTLILGIPKCCTSSHARVIRPYRFFEYSPVFSQNNLRVLKKFCWRF